MLGWKSRYNKAQIFNFIFANKDKTISRLSSDGLKNQPKGFIGRGTGGDAAPYSQYYKGLRYVLFDGSGMYS